MEKGERTVREGGNNYRKSKGRKETGSGAKEEGCPKALSTGVIYDNTLGGWGGGA